MHIVPTVYTHTAVPCGAAAHVIELLPLTPPPLSMINGLPPESKQQSHPTSTLPVTVTFSDRKSQVTCRGNKVIRHLDTLQ